METSSEKEIAKQRILSAVAEYCEKYMMPKKAFAPGDKINYAGRVFDSEELTNLVDSSLEFWLTAGRYAARFERELAEYLDVRFCSLVNSGSSAVLLAFSALTAQELGERRIRRGDEVITVAAGFPTTVSPVLLYGAVPVFVDVEIPSYNIDVSKLEAAYIPGKTKAVIIAHTLGNAFNLGKVKEFCDAHGLWLVEDNCDALGAEYEIDGKFRKTGTVGDLGCSSFYPAHHMTMGEGGAVYTNNPLLHRLVNSFRDWGRDCCCPPGTDNFCRQRFSKQYGELPLGYDHKYVYSHFGYNLKVTDMQAAIGCAQLKKLPAFVEKRRANWLALREALSGLEDKLILPEIEAHSRPSWFGFVMTVRSENGVSREKIVRALEDKKIQTRNLFAGNFTKHPAFDELRKTGAGFRVVGDLTNTDRIMRDTFWVGVFPGMTPEMIAYMAASIREATEENGGYKTCLNFPDSRGHKSLRAA